MPINYSVFAMKNPQKREEAPKYYGKVQARGTADFDVLADEIAYATTLTDGDVANVLRALVKQMKKHLADGKIVKLDGFGSFQFQLSGKGAATEKEYTTSLIKKMNIQFRPGRLIREVQNLTTLTFKKVTTKKVNNVEVEEDDNQSGGGGSNEQGGQEFS